MEFDPNWGYLEAQEARFKGPRLATWHETDVFSFQHRMNESFGRLESFSACATTSILYPESSVRHQRHELCHKILLQFCQALLFNNIFIADATFLLPSVDLFSNSGLFAAMSLEVAGHHGGAPIPSHLEDEGLMYLNDHRTHLDHEKHSYGTEPHFQHPDTQLSKSKQRFFGKNIAVPSRFIVFWSIIFCLLAVLAVVAAGVAGSIAAKRGRNLSSWSGFSQRCREVQMLTAGFKYEHDAHPRRNNHQRKRVLCRECFLSYKQLKRSGFQPRILHFDERLLCPHLALQSKSDQYRPDSQQQLVQHKMRYGLL